MYYHEPVGSINISSPEISLSLGRFFESSWKIERLLEKEFESTWSTGEGDYYWYRVQGSCGEVKCDTHGAEYPDCKSMMFMTVVPARNLGEVCDLLRSPKYTAPVNFKLARIERYSRPVARANIIEGECNVLEEQEFCQVAQCLDYCIDEDTVVFINISSKAVEFIYEHEMSGSISVSGRINFENYQEYIPDVDGFLPVSLEGSFDCSLKLLHNSVLDLTVSSSLEFYSSRYDFSPEGSIRLEGTSQNSSPNRNYVFSVPLILSGQSKITRIFPSNLDINIFSQTEVFPKYVYPFSGSIHLDGTLKEHTSPGYSYTASGNIDVSGEFGLNFYNMGTIVSDFSFYSMAFDFGLEFKDIPFQSNLTIADAVTSPECGCGPLGMTILLNYNLNNSKVFNNFLKRNNMSFETSINLKYKSEDVSWRSVQHFSGLSIDGVTFENWTVLATLQCISELDSWRFSFLAKTQNKTTKRELHTRLLIDMPAQLICFDNDISTNIRTFIGTNKAEVTRGRLIHVVSPSRSAIRPYKQTTAFVDGIFNDYLLYYDDLGLFKDSYWLNNPVEFNISPPTRSEMPTFNLQSIF